MYLASSCSPRTATAASATANLTATGRRVLSSGRHRSIRPKPGRQGSRERRLSERVERYARLRDRLWDGIAAKVPRANIGVGAWALPTLIVYGTPEQQERWIVQQGASNCEALAHAARKRADDSFCARCEAG